jgi:predicted DNA-binding transcriptional regulator AlpA
MQTETKRQVRLLPLKEVAHRLGYQSTKSVRRLKDRDSRFPDFRRIGQFDARDHRRGHRQAIQG